MSSTDKIDNGIQKNSSTMYNAANSMDNKNISNTCNRLHSSHNSTISNESDLSLLSVSLEKELELNIKAIDIDELPAFEIRLISPLGRTPSPIDSENMETPTRPPPISAEERLLLVSSCRNNPDFVALHDINAQISPPSDNENETESYLNRTSSLETIFEGVLLNTPPRQQLSLQSKCKSRSRTNLFERVALNRFNADKENQAPLTKSETPPSKTPATDFSCVKDSSSVYEKPNFT